MMIAIPMNKYNIDYVFFNEQQKKTVNETNFIRIIYSSNIFTLQGITLTIELNKLYFENIPNYFNKYKCIFSNKENHNVIQFIQNLEYNLIPVTAKDIYESKREISEEEKKTMIEDIRNKGILSDLAEKEVDKKFKN